MKTEPALQKSILIEVLAQAFGLSVERIEFWPSLWTSACYILTASDNQRYFLKLTPEDYTLTIASDPNFYLPLTHELHQRGILPYIAYPIQALDGCFIRSFEGFRMILFNYIEGETVGFGEWPTGLKTRLAGLLGRLHRSTTEIQIANVMEERFSLIFEKDLLNDLERLENLSSADRPGVHALSDLLLPHKRELLGLLRRAHELQDYATAACKPRVYCHTDLHGGNLMLDPAGNLHIIDWEGAILAPPEQDLFFFAGQADFWQSFVPAYETEFGPVQLDSKLFGFYYCRRSLEDLADWVNRIMRHNTTAEQDAEDLHSIQHYTLADWPLIEENIAKIQANLTVRNVSSG